MWCVKLHHSMKHSTSLSFPGTQKGGNPYQVGWLMRLASPQKAKANFQPKRNSKCIIFDGKKSWHRKKQQKCIQKAMNAENVYGPVVVSFCNWVPKSPKYCATSWQEGHSLYVLWCQPSGSCKESTKGIKQPHSTQGSTVTLSLKGRGGRQSNSLTPLNTCLRQHRGRMDQARLPPNPRRWRTIREALKETKTIPLSPHTQWKM